MFGAITMRPCERSVGVRKSNSAVIVDTPSGTVRWKAATSIVSRFHSSFWPLALNVMPAILSIALRGVWPPGTHIGYSSVSAPACTGMVSFTRKMRCARLVASTSTLMVPGA